MTSVQIAKQPACLLCGNSEVTVLEDLSVSALATLYQRHFDVEVGRLFSTPSISLCQCVSCDLRYFAPPISGDEAFYAALQRYDWYYVENKPEYEFAAGFITEMDSVLDIGCGRGAFSRRIHARKYTGLDFSSNAAELAAREGILILNDSLDEHAHSHAGSYDVVCAFQVLEHVADIRGFIAASIRCLRPGGTLIYSVPSNEGYLSLATNSISNMPPHHISRWSDQALRNIEQLFQLQSVVVEHEQLTSIHEAHYMETMLAARMKKWCAIKPRILDMRLSHKVITKVASFISGPLRPLLIGNQVINGHTVTAVFRKP